MTDFAIDRALAAKLGLGRWRIEGDRVVVEGPVALALAGTNPAALDPAWLGEVDKARLGGFLADPWGVGDIGVDLPLDGVARRLHLYLGADSPDAGGIARLETAPLTRPTALPRPAEAASIERDLETALAEGQFELRYQPIVDLHRFCAAGIEVLMRWHHPDLGYVSPDRFIPVAERLGLLDRMTEWLVARAGVELRDVLAERAGLRLNINLSARQVRPGLVQSLCHRLRVAGIGAGRTTIEITEVALLEGAAPTLEALQILKEAGCKIALDDFGTGFSSLGYLDQFPIDAIKIDKSFVQRSDTREQAKKLIEAMLFVAQALDLEVVTEGAETETHLAFLAAKGCRYVQGYLFAEPLTLLELDDWLKSFRFPEDALEAALWPTAKGLPRILSDNHEAALKLFVKHVPVAVAMFDQEMRYLAASDCWLSDYGIEDVVGRCHYDLLPDTPQAWRDVHRRVLSGGDVERREREAYVAGSGRRHWLRWEARPFCTNFADVAGLIVFSEFITEQVEAEARRDESERRLNDYLATASDWLWETDAQGRFVQHSQDEEFRKAFNTPLIGKSPWEVAGVDDPANDGVWRPCIEAFAARLPIRDFVFSLVNRRRGLHHVETNANPHFAPDGTFLGYRGVARDVTARIETRSALRQHAEHLRLAGEIGRLAHWVYEVDTDRLRWSEEAWRVLGATPEDGPPDGAPGLALVVDEDRADYRAAWLRALAEGRDVRHQFRVRLADGTLRHILVEARAVKNGSKGYFGIIQDVTEQVRAFEALAAKNRENELYRRMIDQLPDSIYAKDTEGRFIVANAGLAARFGVRSADDLIGRTDHDFLPKDLADRYRADEAAFFAKGETVILDQPLLRSDGTQGRNCSLKSPIRDEDGRIVAYVGHGRDVTELYEAREAALAHGRENEIYRQIIEALPDLVYVKDEAGRFLIANDATARFMGQENARSLIGRTDFDFYPADKARIWRENERRGWEKGSAHRLLSPAYDPTGEWRWMAALKLPIEDGAGRAIGLLGVDRNVSEQVAAEEALKASEARYRDLVEDSLQGLAIVQGRSVAFANPRFVEFFGRDITERPRAALAPQPRPTRERLLRWVLDAEHGQNVDAAERLEVRRGDGTTLWLDVRTRDVVWDNAPALQLTAIDVTRQVAYERAIEAEKRRLQRQAAEMERLAAALNRSKAEAEEAHAALHEAVMALVDGFALFDAQERLIACSPAFAAPYGLTPRAMIGMRFVQTFDRLIECAEGDERAGLQANYARRLECFRCADGVPYEVFMQGLWYEIRDTRTPTGMTIILRSDVTERRQSETELRRLATVDDLTGAFNRRHFLSEGGNALRRCATKDAPATLVMFDVDHFKRVNDTFGHAAGDRVLAAIGDLARGAVRPHDLVARLGGEEFALFMPEAGGAKAAVERLRAKIAGLAFTGPDGRFSVTASFGVAERREGDTIESLLGRADKALYRAKAESRNRTCIAPEPISTRTGLADAALKLKVS